MALEALRPGRPAAFDLDSTVLSNKPRQARIVREFGAQRGDARLAQCTPRQIVSWDLRDTLRLCGLSEPEVRHAAVDLRQFWLDRFFTSEYCADDVPIAGAAAYLQRVREAGGEILYITGRHEEMKDGTLAAF